MMSKRTFETPNQTGGVTPDFRVIAANVTSKQAGIKQDSALATMVAGFVSDGIARRAWSFDIADQDGNVRHHVDCTGTDEFGGSDGAWRFNCEGKVSREAQSAYKEAFQRTFFGLDKPNPAIWTPCTKAVPIARAIRSEGMTATIENGQLKLFGGDGPVADALRNAKSIAAMGKIAKGHGKTSGAGAVNEQRMKKQAVQQERIAEQERSDASIRSAKSSLTFSKIADWFNRIRHNPRVDVAKQTSLPSAPLLERALGGGESEDPDLTSLGKALPSAFHAVEGAEKFEAGIYQTPVLLVRGGKSGYGYSIRLVEKIKKADESLIGVQFGLACIAHDIPVSEVAHKLGVTRPTVYSWFLGTASPRQENAELIRAFLDSRFADIEV